MPAMNLTQQMKDILDGYTDEVMKATIGALEDVAQESAEKLRNTSPRRTGKYARDWDVKSERKRTYASTAVYNKKHYQLTHLLEHGHAMRNGGRSKKGTIGQVEHIAPVNKFAEETAVRKISEAIKGIK